LLNSANAASKSASVSLDLNDPVTFMGFLWSFRFRFHQSATDSLPQIAHPFFSYIATE